MRRAVETFRVAEGLDLTADVAGDGRRGSVILAHGGGQTRHSWALAAERLADAGWKTYALDLRGHGDSGWPADGDYRIERFAEDLLAVARAAPHRPALVGASLGGMAGLVAEAVLAPGAFVSLTLVDIIPNADPVGVERIMSFMSANLETGFDSLEAAADSIAAYLPHRPRPRSLAGLGKNLRLGADGRYRWHWDPRFVAGTRAARGQGALGDLEARVRALDLPIHLVRGGLSELAPLEAAQAFVATLRNGAFSDVAGAGHMVAGDRNDAFFDAVAAFLDRTSPVAGARPVSLGR